MDPGQLLLEEIFIHRNVLTKQTHSTTISAQLRWLQISRYQFSYLTLPARELPIAGVGSDVEYRQTFTPAIHHKITKTRNLRQMTGTGSNSFTIPAMMIGTNKK